MSRKGWLLFVAMGVIWGLPYLLIKIAVRQVAPPMLVEMRTGGAALLLLPLALGRGELAPVLRRWRPLVAFAVAEMAVPWLFLFSAERRLSSSLSGLLVAAVPIIGTVLGALTGVERLDLGRLGGVALGLGGVAALVGFDVSGSDGWAAASIGIVAIGYALGPWILSRHLSDLPNLGVISAALALCAVIYAPIAAFDVPAHALSRSVVLSVAGLTLVCTALAFVVFFALIAEVGPVRSTVITYVNPAVAVLLGVTVLGEHFGFGTAAGFVLIILGCVLATGHAPHRSPSSPPLPDADQSGAAEEAPIALGDGADTVADRAAAGD
ncbi:MAG TPA: EamA family transporter [Acidimicrobiales bacterium]|nr:EamA family transporter [Acidimicrobiales bacterium]